MPSPSSRTIKEKCRICNRDSGVLFDVFQCSENRQYNLEIEQCLSLKVSEDDNITSRICYHCEHNLKLSCELIEQFNSSKHLKNKCDGSFTDFCYLCSTNEGALFDLKSSANKLNCTVCKIQSCLFFTVPSGKNISYKICHSCAYKLDVLHDLRQTALKTQHELMGQDVLGGANETQNVVNKKCRHCLQMEKNIIPAVLVPSEESSSIVSRKYSPRLRKQRSSLLSQNQGNECSTRRLKLGLTSRKTKQETSSAVVSPILTDVKEEHVTTAGETLKTENLLWDNSVAIDKNLCSETAKSRDVISKRRKVSCGKNNSPLIREISDSDVELSKKTNVSGKISINVRRKYKIRRSVDIKTAEIVQKSRAKDQVNMATLKQCSECCRETSSELYVTNFQSTRRLLCSVCWITNSKTNLISAEKKNCFVMLTDVMKVETYKKHIAENTTGVGHKIVTVNPSTKRKRKSAGSDEVSPPRKFLRKETKRCDFSNRVARRGSKVLTNKQKNGNLRSSKQNRSSSKSSEGSVIGLMKSADSLKLASRNQGKIVHDKQFAEDSSIKNSICFPENVAYDALRIVVKRLDLDFKSELNVVTENVQCKKENMGAKDRKMKFDGEHVRKNAPSSARKALQSRNKINSVRRVKRKHSPEVPATSLKKQRVSRPKNIPKLHTNEVPNIDPKAGTSWEHIDPYICSICMTKFSRQMDGKVHELKHANKVPVLMLKRCDVSFSSISSKTNEDVASPEPTQPTSLTDTQNTRELALLSCVTNSLESSVEQDSINAKEVICDNPQEKLQEQSQIPAVTEQSKKTHNKEKATSDEVEDQKITQSVERNEGEEKTVQADVVKRNEIKKTGEFNGKRGVDEENETRDVLLTNIVQKELTSDFQSVDRSGTVKNTEQAVSESDISEEQMRNENKQTDITNEYHDTTDNISSESLSKSKKSVVTRNVNEENLVTHYTSNEHNDEMDVNRVILTDEDNDKQLGVQMDVKDVRDLQKINTTVRKDKFKEFVTLPVEGNELHEPDEINIKQHLNVVDESEGQKDIQTDITDKSENLKFEQSGVADEVGDTKTKNDIDNQEMIQKVVVNSDGVEKVVQKDAKDQGRVHDDIAIKNKETVQENATVQRGDSEMVQEVLNDAKEDKRNVHNVDVDDSEVGIKCAADETKDQEGGTNESKDQEVSADEINDKESVKETKHQAVQEADVNESIRETIQKNADITEDQEAEQCVTYENCQKTIQEAEVNTTETEPVVVGCETEGEETIQADVIHESEVKEEQHKTNQSKGPKTEQSNVSDKSQVQENKTEDKTTDSVCKSVGNGHKSVPNELSIDSEGNGTLATVATDDQKSDECQETVQIQSDDEFSCDQAYNTSEDGIPVQMNCDLQEDNKLQTIGKSGVVEVPVNLYSSLNQYDSLISEEDFNSMIIDEDFKKSNGTKITEENKSSGHCDNRSKDIDKIEEITDDVGKNGFVVCNDPNKLPIETYESLNECLAASTVGAVDECVSQSKMTESDIGSEEFSLELTTAETDE